MRAILSAPGSRGDVNPMIAIGRALKTIGFEVVISLAEPYAEIAQHAGLDVEPVVSSDAFHQMVGDPNVWKPIRGPRALMRGVASEFLAAHYEVIRRHHRPGETVLVSHPLDLASRVHRDFDSNTPLVDVHLAPSILRTSKDRPRLSPWWFETWMPNAAMSATYWFADCFLIDPLICKTLNPFRKQLGLPPVRRVLDRWWLSPDRILAMYPEWFAPATAEYSPRLKHVGFPLDDADDRPCEVVSDRPVVFTGGTAHHHSLAFFQRAIDACVELDQPGLLVSTHEENFPLSIPSLVKTASYVSFSNLLPQASMLVHHGGIGSTSQAMSAGIPQVVRPMAFDQFDNATRVEHLGCGRWLKRDKDLAQTIRQLLDSKDIASSCGRTAKQMNATNETAAAKAAAEIAAVLQRSAKRWRAEE